jgi:hypothetical protein
MVLHVYVQVQHHTELGFGMVLNIVCFHSFLVFLIIKICLVLCLLGWLNYQIYCQKYGADLLVIKTQAEFNLIQPYASTIIGSYTYNPTPRKSLFIQINKIILFYLAGVFYWVDPMMPAFSANEIQAPGATMSGSTEFSLFFKYSSMWNWCLGNTSISL